MTTSARASPTRTIDVRDVSVWYGRVRALEDVNLSVRQGISALLGPNGAGKTTLMSCVVGLKKFSGEISVVDDADGSPSRSSVQASDVGYLPQMFDLSPGLTCMETVQFASWCHGLSRKDATGAGAAALERVGLEGKASHKVKTLSGGQRQRLGIACAVAHDPPVLLLDEPTVGLDPTQRYRLREHLTAIAETTCVLVSTHLLEDVQVMASRVVIIDAGKVCFDDTKEAMIKYGDMNKEADESSLEAAYRTLTDRPSTS